MAAELIAFAESKRAELQAAAAAEARMMPAHAHGVAGGSGILAPPMLGSPQSTNESLAGDGASQGRLSDRERHASFGAA